MALPSKDKTTIIRAWLKRISRMEGRFQFDTTTTMIAQRWLCSATVIDHHPFRCFLSLKELRPEMVRWN
jgi:hypothetical protein